ncbi:FolC bifunctional protein, partial [Lizonia empirigonia]
MAKIQPGLERIAELLKNVDFPWKSIHVAGTNGKGSICHHAASIIIGNTVKVGKFTSPHLVDRWDCISINGKPVEEKKFRKVESHFLQMNASRQIGASPFEILTATAFTIFNDAKVKLGVVEVGMGGKLDSTSILNNQTVSVISKIARDHEAFLGNTLSEIAAHKAGILRPNVPYLVTSANEPNVVNVINDYADEIGAGPRLSTASFNFEDRLYDSMKWQRLTRAMAPFQQENMKLAAVAVMETFQSMKKDVKPTDIAKTLLANMKIRQPGRQEMVQVPPIFRNYGESKSLVLLDGAHNPDAAEALDEFVQYKLRFGQTPAKERPASGWPVTWVLAMTEGKDAHEYLAKLLKPGDKVVTTAFGPVDGMPWVKPMDPRTLLDVAKSAQPEITGIHMPFLGALRALSAAKYLSDQMADWAPIAITGSLYLVGDFHREMRERPPGNWWESNDEAMKADRRALFKMQVEERERVDAFL